jgi:hypothetical protein
MSIIFYNIKPLYQTSIEGSTSQEMWNRQQLEYANMAVANATQLLGKFHQYRMDPDHSVTAHIKRLRQMSEELRSVNSPVPEEVLIMRILQTLPPSFDNFLTFWNNVNLSEQTLTNLTSKLLAWEMKLQTRNNDVMNPTDVAFFPHTHQESISHNKRRTLALTEATIEVVERAGETKTTNHATIHHITEVVLPTIEVITNGNRRGQRYRGWRSKRNGF